MSLVRSPETAEMIQREYTRPEPVSGKILISSFVRPSQKRIIDAVAVQTGRGKGEVLRAIIDEWAAAQLPATLE